MPEPDFRVMPPLRCCFRTEFSALPFCAKLAAWQRPANHAILAQVFCELHKEAGDLAIYAPLMLRRVSLELQVMLHGMALTSADAHSEGLLSLEGAVQSIGGLLNIHSVTSEIGRFTLPPGPERRKARFGEG